MHPTEHMLWYLYTGFRVTLMKKQITPRLELLGATILSRLVYNILEVPHDLKYTAGQTP